MSVDTTFSCLLFFMAYTKTLREKSSTMTSTSVKPCQAPVISMVSQCQYWPGEVLRCTAPRCLRSASDKEWRSASGVLRIRISRDQLSWWWVSMSAWSAMAVLSVICCTAARMPGSWESKCRPDTLSGKTRGLSKRLRDSVDVLQREQMSQGNSS